MVEKTAISHRTLSYYISSFPIKNEHLTSVEDSKTFALVNDAQSAKSYTKVLM